MKRLLLKRLKKDICTPSRSLESNFTSTVSGKKASSMEKFLERSSTDNNLNFEILLFTTFANKFNFFYLNKRQIIINFFLQI